MRQAVSTSSAPQAIGPYSQAIRAGYLLFVSGQIPLDPATGTMVTGDIGDQTRRVFQNLGRNPQSRRRLVRSRRPDDRVSRGHGGLRRDERGVRDLLLDARAGALDRPGGRPAKNARVEIDVIAAS